MYYEQICGAIVKGHFDRVRELASRIPDDVPDKTLLYSKLLVCSARNRWKSLVEYFVDLGGSIQTHGCDALNSFIESLIKREVWKDPISFGILDFLLDKGVDINRGIGELFPDLTEAQHNIDIVKYLLKNGADIKLVCDEKALVNSISANNETLDMLKLLAKYGAKQLIKYGKTLILKSISNDRLDALTYLVDEVGVDLNIARPIIEEYQNKRNYDGYGTLLTNFSRREIIEYLRSKGLKLDELPIFFDPVSNKWPELVLDEMEKDTKESILIEFSQLVQSKQRFSKITTREYTSELYFPEIVDVLKLIERRVKYLDETYKRKPDDLQQERDKLYEALVELNYKRVGDCFLSRLRFIPVIYDVLLLVDRRIHQLNKQISVSPFDR